MIRVIAFCFFAFFYNALIATEQNHGFILMTTLYNEKNIARQKEFLECFQKNRASLLIEKIIILYEGYSADSLIQMILKEDEENCKTSIIYIQKRPCFSDFFRIANENYKGRKIIICNADIYFDSSLGMISESDLDNTLICLTRWTLKNDGQCYATLANYNASRYEEVKWSKKLQPKWFSSSYDSWIFLAPIREFNADMLIGTLGCEKVGYHAYLSGMNVMNPALSILTYHKHDSEIRTYNRSVFLYPPPYLHLRLKPLSKERHEKIYFIQ